MMKVIISLTLPQEVWVDLVMIQDASAKASVLLFDLTEKQLKDWGCKYHTLILGKPHADFFIDDKGVNSDEFFRTK
tara:strand:- start:83 stop:310 length:228 start_codon:yes stop_codon:yes gene_type:complete